MSTLAQTAPVNGGSLPGSSWLAQPSPGLIGWAERGLIPDFLVRMGIRKLLAERLTDEGQNNPDLAQERHAHVFAKCMRGPLAVQTKAANEQHYEVGADFFKLALGPHRKYSSCWFHPQVEDLGQAENAMLQQTCEKALIVDGDRILELGCGWGSLTLYIAQHYPQCHITAVSNSHRQKISILADCQRLGLNNVDVITANLVDFTTEEKFDRVVSVECFEHLRNHRLLFKRISSWLNEHGTCFVHIFTHRNFAYLFEDDGDKDWMARHFFSGGMMPSDRWLLLCQDDLVCQQHWQVSGTHYAKTSECWLRNLDKNKDAAIECFVKDGLTPAAAHLQVNRWRIFFMACAELWGYADGNEWMVSHYRFAKR
jgi:cyclopropane-fatty-acyl-phospholipid synthase